MFISLFIQKNLTVANEVKYGLFELAPLDLLLNGGEINSFSIKTKKRKNKIILLTLHPDSPCSLPPSSGFGYRISLAQPSILDLKKQWFPK